MALEYQKQRWQSGYAPTLYPLMIMGRGRDRPEVYMQKILNRFRFCLRHSGVLHTIT